jgi:hypothetical protein
MGEMVPHPDCYSNLTYVDLPCSSLLAGNSLAQVPEATQDVVYPIPAFVAMNPVIMLSSFVLMLAYAVSRVKTWASSRKGIELPSRSSSEVELMTPPPSSPAKQSELPLPVVQDLARGRERRLSMRLMNKLGFETKGRPRSRSVGFPTSDVGLESQLPTPVPPSFAPEATLLPSHALPRANDHETLIDFSSESPQVREGRLIDYERDPGVHSSHVWAMDLQFPTSPPRSVMVGPLRPPSRPSSPRLFAHHSRTPSSPLIRQEYLSTVSLHAVTSSPLSQVASAPSPISPDVEPVRYALQRSVVHESRPTDAVLVDLFSNKPSSVAFPGATIDSSDEQLIDISLHGTPSEPRAPQPPLFFTSQGNLDGEEKLIEIEEDVYHPSPRRAATSISHLDSTVHLASAAERDLVSPSMAAVVADIPSFSPKVSTSPIVSIHSTPNPEPLLEINHSPAQSAGSQSLVLEDLESLDDGDFTLVEEDASISEPKNQLTEVEDPQPRLEAPHEAEAGELDLNDNYDILTNLHSHHHSSKEPLLNDIAEASVPLTPSPVEEFPDPELPSITDIDLRDVSFESDVLVSPSPAVEEFPDPELPSMADLNQRDMTLGPLTKHNNQLPPVPSPSTEEAEEENDAEAPNRRPDWSIRASEAPALGLAASPSARTNIESPVNEEKNVSTSTVSTPSPVLSPSVEQDEHVPGSFPISGSEDKTATEQPTPTALQPTASTSRPRVMRSAIDIALAMQLRPGLGLGSDPAWMVRFLMSMFGWFVVTLSGGGDFERYASTSLLEN